MKDEKLASDVFRLAHPTLKHQKHDNDLLVKEQLFHYAAMGIFSFR